MSKKTMSENVQLPISDAQRCEVCAGPGAISREVFAKHGGTWQLCESCWADYCAMFGSPLEGTERDWNAYVQQCPQVQPGVALPVPPNAWMIYALSDPRTQAVRYVGRTQHLIQRRRQHLANESGGPKKRAWVEELACENLQPVMHVVEVIECEAEDAETRERMWRATFRNAGMGLLNNTREGLDPAGDALSIRPGAEVTSIYDYPDIHTEPPKWR